jgi:hypothetical protein
MFQSGSESITNGVSQFTITYPVAFAADPDVIIAVVRNTSADSPKYIIQASITEQSATAFTVSLDAATTSGNYELVWLAGSAASILDTMSVLAGRKLTSYGALASLINAEFKMPLLDMAGIPALKLVDATTFWSAVVQRASAVPASPLAALTDTMSMTLHEGWLYISDSDQWVRIPADRSVSWTDQPFYVPFREREITFVEATPGADEILVVADQLVYTIEFDTPFEAGNDPKVLLQLVDLNGAAVFQYTAQVTRRDLDGFDVTFSAPIQNYTLQLYYMARQLP